MDKKRTAQLAEDYGLAGVIRWKPKNVRYTLSKSTLLDLLTTDFCIVEKQGGIACIRTACGSAADNVRNRWRGSVTKGSYCGQRFCKGADFDAFGATVVIIIVQDWCIAGQIVI